MTRLKPVGPVRRRNSLPPAIRAGIAVVAAAALFAVIYALLVR